MTTFGTVIPRDTTAALRPTLPFEDQPIIPPQSFAALPGVSRGWWRRAMRATAAVATRVSE